METMTLDIKVEKMHKLAATGTFKAYADVSFNGVMTIKGFKVVEGRNGLFIGCPSTKGKGDGKYFDIIHFTDDEVRNQLTAVILEAYKK